MSPAEAAAPRSSKRSSSTKSKRGIFVTFEGGEGSGKSTQSGLLKEALEARGRRVIRLREPGGTKLGEDLRQVLLNSPGIDRTTELLLFLSARAELVAKTIRPALRDGIDVVCDRFIDSTAAYQGYGRGIDLALIRSLNKTAIGDAVPDLTVLLDIEPGKGLSRVSKGSGGDAIEGHWQAELSFPENDGGAGGKRVGGRDLAFHETVRAGYRALAESEPERWLVLDANRPAQELAEAIIERVEGLLAHRSARRSSKASTGGQASLNINP
jgi:dTMP kinase